MESDGLCPRNSWWRGAVLPQPWAWSCMLCTTLYPFLFSDLAISEAPRGHSVGLVPPTSAVRSLPEVWVCGWAPKDDMIGEPLTELSHRVGRTPVGATSWAHPVPERKVLCLAGPWSLGVTLKEGLSRGLRAMVRWNHCIGNHFLFVIYVLCWLAQYTCEVRGAHLHLQFMDGELRPRQDEWSAWGCQVKQAGLTLEPEFWGLLTWVSALCKGASCSRQVCQRPSAPGEGPQVLKGSWAQMSAPAVWTLGLLHGRAESQPAGPLRYSTEPTSSSEEWVQRGLAPRILGLLWD